jgi:hypothetical protein
MSETKNSWNLLESTKYYKNGLQLVNILNGISELNIDYEIISGFKGYKCFDICNKFKSCVISLKNIDDINTIKGFLDKYELDVDIDDNDGIVEIHLKD